jgi:hypothetical protein
MKTYWGNGGIAPRILDFGTRWRWVVSFTPRPLYPKVKSPRYPLDRRLGGPQIRSWRGGKEKNSHPRRESNPRTLIVQPIAQNIYIHTCPEPTFDSERKPWEGRTAVRSQVLALFRFVGLCTPWEWWLPIDYRTSVPVSGVQPDLSSLLYHAGPLALWF